MKLAVPSITAEADTSAFSMGEFVYNDVVSATSEDIGKLKNEISALQFKVRRMMPSDTRNKPNTKPWKPEVTPPRRKGSNFRGRGFRQNDSGRRENNSSGQTITVTRIEISVTETSQETIMGIENLLETGAKIMAILVETKEVEAEVEVDLIQVPMSED